MAIAQDEFKLFRGIGYEGQVSSIELADIKSRLVMTGFIPFGRAVVRGSEKRSCAPVSGDTLPEDIIGFTVRTMAEASNTPPVPPNENTEYAIGYPVDHVASILHRGPMHALCVDGAKAGEAVVVLTAEGENLGRLSANVEGVTLDFVTWLDDVVAGDIGEIQANGIFAAPTVPAGGDNGGTDGGTDGGTGS